MMLKCVISIILILGIMFYLNKGNLLEGFNNGEPTPSPAPIDDSSNSPAPIDDSSNSPAPIDDSSNSPAPIDDSSNSLGLEPIDDSSNSPAPIDDSSNSPAPIDKQNTISPTITDNKIDVSLLIEELLNILNTLNKPNLSDEDKDKIEKSLDYIDDIIINSKNEQYNDVTKLPILRKLLSENKKIFQKIGSERNELEAIKATFGSGGSGGSGDYTKSPTIPNIAQFKPSGTSNIFSPIIKVNSDPLRNDNNKRYSNAYEKGFEKGLTRTGANIIDQSTSITDTSISQQVRDTTVSGDTTVNGDIGSNGIGPNGIGPNGKQSEKDKQTSIDNGYIKGDNNGIIQKPGYSYLDPNLWDVPRKRAPVCYSKGDMDRKENSLDPAGFVFGGPSNVMEFHGVGSIMPKFLYKESVTEVESAGDL